MVVVAVVVVVVVAVGVVVGVVVVVAVGVAVGVAVVLAHYTEVTSIRTGKKMPQRMLTADEIHEITDQVSIHVTDQELRSAALRRSSRYPNRHVEWVVRIHRHGTMFDCPPMTYNEALAELARQKPFKDPFDQKSYLSIEIEEKLARHLTIEERKSEAVNRVRFQED